MENNNNNKYLKRYMILSICYAFLGALGGVFYREFTKFNNYNDVTRLSFIHSHYLMLGMVFFILLLLLEKSFRFSDKKVSLSIIFYNIGLNITTIMFLIRGILEVIGFAITSKIDAIISGIAGIGHVLLGVTLILILIFIFINVFKKKKEENI